MTMVVLIIFMIVLSVMAYDDDGSNGSDNLQRLMPVCDILLKELVDTRTNQFSVQCSCKNPCMGHWFSLSTVVHNVYTHKCKYKIKHQYKHHWSHGSLFCTTTCYLLFSVHCISKYQIQDKYRREEITCSREMMENNFTTDHQSLQSLHKWQNFWYFLMFAVSAESNCARVRKIIVEPVFA